MVFGQTLGSVTAFSWKAVGRASERGHVSTRTTAAGRYNVPGRGRVGGQLWSAPSDRYGSGRARQLPRFIAGKLSLKLCFPEGAGRHRVQSTHCGHTPHRIRSREPVARTLLGRRACTSNVGLDSVTLNKPCAWPPIRPSSLNRCRTMRLHITSMLPGGAASARHWQFRRLRCLRRRLRSEVSVRADRVTNTHRAAVLRQHGAKTISTRDRDFRKSEGLTGLEPLG